MRDTIPASRPARTRTRSVMPTCRDMASLASRRLDGPLPWGQRAGAALHLVFCRVCRRYWRQLRWIRRAILSPEALEAPRPAPAPARSRWKAALHAGCADD